MTGFSEPDRLLVEARRKVPPAQVSEHDSFLADAKDYEEDANAGNELEVIYGMFKNREFSALKRKYNDHELTEKELVGSRLLHLFPGTAKDVVIVYKQHSNDHVVFHRIRSHGKVYDPDYGSMDRERRKSGFRRGRS